MKNRKTPSSVLGALLLGALLAVIAQRAHSQDFASAVVDYTPGTGTNVASYSNPSAALGKPGGAPGGSVLSPFDPNYQTSELTSIGTGGQLTLQLANFVKVGIAGTRELGIFGNVGLVDTSSGFTGMAGNPATVFGEYSVRISVSADGLTFVPLNAGQLIDSTLPSNYYTNATGPYDAPPANPTFADFGLPFTGALSSFNGENFGQTLQTLNGSAGGTWLDLSGTGLTQVGYVRFTETAADGTFFLNGVSGNEALLGAAVPEPRTWGLLALGVGLGLAFRFGRRPAFFGGLVASLWVTSAASAQTFALANIQNWTGTGSNSAALVIDWYDGKTPESIAWGYRWNGTATGLQMIQAIDAADPRLAVFYAYGGSYVYGIGYDLNNNGSTFTPGTPGNETGSGSDPADHYEEGVFTQFFGYDIASASPYGGGGTWTQSNTGADGRTLTNGAWDGYSLSTDETNFTIPDPRLPTAAAAVPEPSAFVWSMAGAVAVGAWASGGRKRRPARLA